MWHVVKELGLGDDLSGWIGLIDAQVDD